jgi:hypothetical protein
MTDSRNAAQITTQQNIQAEISAYIQEKVSSRAYELWIERGCPIGSPEIDWFRAVAEITPGASVLEQSQRLVA